MTVEIDLPVVGGSNGTWGDELNVAFEVIRSATSTALTTAQSAESTATSASSLASDAAATASSAMTTASDAETAATAAAGDAAASATAASTAAADAASAAADAEAAALAVDGKVDTTDPRLSDARTPTAHTHAQSEVTNLVTDLAGKAAAAHTHAQSDVTGLVTALAGKADASHNHDTRYYTETEVDALLAAVSARVQTQPTGTAVPGGTPDGTLWVEYTP